jgi:predicted component of type VI protein secretion system
VRSDASLDQEIRTLESRIRDRRLALRASFAQVKYSAQDVKARVRAKAASPLVWLGALALGFVAVRLARRRPQRARTRFRAGRDAPATRPLIATLLSAALPFGLRLAQQSLVPWIARTVRDRAARRRRGYDGYYGS